MDGKQKCFFILFQIFCIDQIKSFNDVSKLFAECIKGFVGIVMLVSAEFQQINLFILFLRFHIEKSNLPHKVPTSAACPRCT